MTAIDIVLLDERTRSAGHQLDGVLSPVIPSPEATDALSSSSPHRLWVPRTDSPEALLISPASDAGRWIGDGGKR